MNIFACRCDDLLPRARHLLAKGGECLQRLHTVHHQIFFSCRCDDLLPRAGHQRSSTWPEESVYNAYMQLHQIFFTCRCDDLLPRTRHLLAIGECLLCLHAVHHQIFFPCRCDDLLPCAGHRRSSTGPRRVSTGAYMQFIIKYSFPADVTTSYHALDVYRP